MRRLASRKQAQQFAATVGLPAGPLSYSQINTYMICPKSYEFKYIIKPEMIKLFTPPLLFGSIIHQGLESIGKTIMNGGRPNYNNVRDVTHTALHEGIQKIGKLTTEEKLLANRMLDGVQQLIKKWMIDELPELRPTGIEETIYAEIEGIPLVVKIDLINNDKEVIDYKLTKRFKSKTDAQDSLQLSLYGLVTELKHVGFTNLRTPNFTTKKKWKPEISTVRAVKNSTDLEWAGNIVGSVSNAIMAGVFPHCDPASWKCSFDYCEYFPLCRGKQKIPTKRPDFMKNMLGDW